MLSTIAAAHTSPSRVPIDADAASTAFPAACQSPSSTASGCTLGSAASGQPSKPTSIAATVHPRASRCLTSAVPTPPAAPVTMTGSPSGSALTSIHLHRKGFEQPWRQVRRAKALTVRCRQVCPDVDHKNSNREDLSEPAFGHQLERPGADFARPQLNRDLVADPERGGVIGLRVHGGVCIALREQFSDRMPSVVEPLLHSRLVPAKDASEIDDSSGVCVRHDHTPLKIGRAHV